MLNLSNHFRPSIRLTVVTIFVLATLITAALAVGLQYYFSRSIATQAAVSQFDATVSEVADHINGIDSRTTQITSLLASHPDLVEQSWVTPEVRQLFAEYLKVNPTLYAIYLGFDNGDFFELINLDCCSTVRQQYRALPEDRWVVITIRGSGPEKSKTQAYYNSDFELRHLSSEPSRYNAATRPWFVQARTDQVNRTTPYWFELLQAPGQTYSRRLQNAPAVIGVDITLEFLSAYLHNQSLHNEADFYLYTQNGDLIASSAAETGSYTLPQPKQLTLSAAEQAIIARQGVLKVSNENDWAPIDFVVAGRPQGLSIDVLTLIGQMTGLRFEFINGFSWQQLQERFKRREIDLLQSVLQTELNQNLGLFSQPFVSLSYALVTRPDSAPYSDLSELTGKTVAILEGWSIIPMIRSMFPQITIKEVATTQNILEAVRRGQADAGLDCGEILHYLGQKYYYSDLVYHDAITFSSLDVPQQLHLVLHPENAELLPILNRALGAISAEQLMQLKNKWFAEHPQQHQLGNVPDRQLITLAGRNADQWQLNRMKIAGEDSFVFIAPIGRSAGKNEYLAIVKSAKAVLNPALSKVKWSILLTLLVLLVLLPAPWLFAAPIVAPINALSRANEKIRLRQYDQLEIPGSRIKEIDELGISLKSMAASIQAYQKNQQELLDSFIQLIAQAIDDKSPYTGGHCSRVPELAVMLAEEAGVSREEPFSDFAFTSEEQWREFRIGAWLHDCGKITTPLHIVDKGTKLETICNRIHEIRTRFEVLWRDAEIDYLHQVRQNPDGQPGYEAALVSRRTQLQDDFAFLARVNLGEEFLDPAQQARLEQIATQTWTRHFSDRLGISPPEESRRNGTETLPCEERLLADKAEHIIPHDRDISYAPELGIRLDIPEHQANQGELYNLLIKRGTLTREDRFIINEHVISTIRMLDNLPLTDDLAQVPKFASTHHETLDGNGYPRRLTAEALSVPERIMVLADIFEALTAADRPYKKAKTISVAIDVLHKMVEDHHVDRDVFELFLKSGIYLKYAQRFLPPSQIDSVDIASYLRQPEVTQASA